MFIMSIRDKWVRRFSVDETAKHQNGFTIYKITSVLFPLESPEAVTVVSVWKRYSDVQQLHRSTRALHAGLHLRGVFPALHHSSYFTRFQPQVIEERAKSIKVLLEFIAEHRLLFTSTDFVNFLQTGYPEPESSPGGVINAIRSSLHLPIEDTPPLEYHTSDEDSRSPQGQNTQEVSESFDPSRSEPGTDLDISQIKIYEAADVEFYDPKLDQTSPKTSRNPSNSSSFESIDSLESIDSDLYGELSKMSVDGAPACVRRNVLPDLINFDVPSTSRYDDYHTMPGPADDAASVDSAASGVDSIASGLDSTVSGPTRRRPLGRALSRSGAESRAQTEDSYVFLAGYSLNLGARCEELGDYPRAFEYYKAGIEEMLVGVRTDTDRARRALIKEKINKYMEYAEDIYREHLSHAQRPMLCEQEAVSAQLHCSVPLSMLARGYGELARYRVLAVLGSSMMLVMHDQEHKCYAMKVIQKIPRNLPEGGGGRATLRPVLPTLIPYMVPLHAFVETDDLIFLVLAYAAGERLLDYVRNYSDSNPDPPRKGNLENVFSEPMKRADIQNDNVPQPGRRGWDNPPGEGADGGGLSAQSSVDELVTNSQKLLLNVDKALSEVPTLREDDGGAEAQESEVGTETRVHDAQRGRGRALPAGAVRLWAAQILTALESLHNAGVVCRDLHRDNILLGSAGQVTLTYCLGYPGTDMALAALRARPGRPGLAGCPGHPGRRAGVAPELYSLVPGEPPPGPERACDYWSFGVIMYELICGEPPCSWGAPPPAALPLEQRSLLTQLLAPSPSSRLGAGAAGVEEIKRHPYFNGVDWQSVYREWVVPG